MPRVPKIDELQVGVGSIDTRQINPVQARLTDAGSGGYDLSRLRTQESRPRFDAGAPLQALRFSDEPSRQLIQTGGIIADWADMRREIGIREADELDRARVTDAQNQYISAVLDAANNEQSGWKTRQGLAAMPDKTKQRTLEDEVFETLNKRRTEILDSLGNDRQKQAFAQYAAEEDLRQRQAIQTHVLRESVSYREGVLKASGELAGGMIATGDEQEYALGKSRIEETLAQEAHMHGYSPEQIAVRRQELASSYVRAAITRRIQGGDLQGALAMLDQERPYLNAGDYLELKQTWQTAQDVQEGRAIGEDLLAGGDVAFEPAAVGDPYAAFNQGFHDGKYRQKAFGVESGHKADAKNPKSTAYGYAQALSGTWIAFGNSAAGQQLRGNMNKAQWLSMRSNKDYANAFMDWYRDESIAHFKRTGVPVNDTTMYLAHFLGWHGAASVYKAPPGTPNGQVINNYRGKKGVYASNKNVMDSAPTTDKLVAWAAKKMDVKPTGEQAPQPAPRMSNAQIKQYAAQVAGDNSTKRQTIIDTYTTGRDVQIEAQQQQHAAVMSESISHIWSGGKVSELPPELLTQMSGEDLIKLVKMEGEAANTQEAWLERESWSNYMRYSDPTWLAQKSREQVMALATELGRRRTEQLVAKWESVQKSGDGGRKRGEEEKAVVDTTIRKALGEDLYAEAKKDALYMDALQYRVQEAVNEFMPEVEAGRMTREDMFLTIESELRQEFMNEAEKDGWLWIDRAESLKPFTETDIRRPFAAFTPQAFDFGVQADTDDYSLDQTIRYLRW